MLSVRTATLEDAKFIVAIKEEIVKAADFFLRLPEDDQETAEEYRKKIRKKQESGGLTIVAESNNEVIGFLSFSRSSYKRLYHTGPFGVGIKLEHLNKGVGTKLLSYLIKWAKEQDGLEKINLDVFSNNQQAIHFYKKLGFKEEGKQINQVRLKDGSYADVIYMALAL